MDGPNGLRPREALVLENAVSVSGQKSSCILGACPIWGRDK